MSCTLQSSLDQQNLFFPLIMSRKLNPRAMLTFFTKKLKWQIEYIFNSFSSWLSQQECYNSLLQVIFDTFCMLKVFTRKYRFNMHWNVQNVFVCKSLDFCNNFNPTYMNEKIWVTSSIKDLNENGLNARESLF